MPEPRLTHARKEMDNAKDSFEMMQSSKSLDKFEKNWRDYLNALEKVWKKAERECQEFKNSFMPWQGKFIKQRRVDPLLKYLKNARDTDNHSIEEIVEKVPGKVELRPPKGRKVTHIEKLEIKNGKIVSYKGDPLEAHHFLPRISAKPFTNKGKVYSLPQYHRGSGIKDPQNPIELAILGLKYYADYVSMLEQKISVWSSS